MSDVKMSEEEEVVSEEEEEEEGEEYHHFKEENRPTDVSFHRPTNTEELLALQQAPDDIPTLFGDDGIITLEELIIGDTDGNVDQQGQENCTMTVAQSKLLHLTKLLKLLSELISTEGDYVRDMGLLCDFLDECTFSSKSAVYSFVNSTTFIGFRVAADNIRSINTLFLKKLEEHVGMSHHIDDTRDKLTDETLSFTIDKLDLLCNAFDQFSPLFTQYKHLIQLHRPITILYAALGDDSSFLKFVYGVEKKLAQNFLSLSIKPVQRLPRYILLLKEMLKCVHRSIPLFDGCHKGALVSARSNLRETCVVISNCTLQCNNAMREYEDLQKLHQLDRQFNNCELKKKHSFVTIQKNRVFVLEGTLKRRHDRIGIKSYLCHVLSDVMLISVVTGKGGLRLKNIIPLHNNCGVACIPIPNPAIWSTESIAEGCWFAVVAQKIMFFFTNSSNERDKWVRAINSVLQKNDADFDILHNADRMRLYNKYVHKYHKRHDDSETGRGDAENAVSITQVNWWNILSNAAGKSMDETLKDGNSKSSSRLLRTFDRKKIGPLEQIFGDECGTHYPICFNYFFDSPKKTSRLSSGTDFHPPVIIKLYLFHDVLVAATLNGNDDGRSSYYFHISVKSLEVSGDSSPLAITLVNTSIVGNKSLMQSLWKSEVREHTIISPSAEDKRKWMMILQEAKSSVKSVEPISLDSEYCTKVRCAGLKTWQYEERPSVNWDNL